VGYGAGLADNLLDKGFLFYGPDLIERVPETSDNKDWANKGHEYPTEQYLDSWSVKKKRSMACSVEALAWLASLAFGSDTVTQPDAVNNPTVYSHAFKPFSTLSAQQLPSTVYAEKVDQYRVKKYPGIVVADLSLSGESTKFLSLEANLLGSGALAAFAGSLPAAMTCHYLRFHAATLKLGDHGGALTDISPRFKKFSFKWDNAPDTEDGFHPGAGFAVAGDPDSGAIMGRLERGEPKLDLSFSLRVASDQQRQDLEDNEELALQIIIDGKVITVGKPETYQATLDVYKLGYTAVSSGFEKGIEVYNISTRPLYDGSISKIVQLTVQNTVAAYLL
jgi:hypothetical protein